MKLSDDVCFVLFRQGESRIDANLHGTDSS